MSYLTSHDLNHKNGLIIGQAGCGKSFIIGKEITFILENSNDFVLVYAPYEGYTLENISAELKEKIRFEPLYNSSKSSDEAVPAGAWIFCDEYNSKNYNTEGLLYLLSVAKVYDWKIIIAAQSIRDVDMNIISACDYAYIMAHAKEDNDIFMHTFKVGETDLENNLFVNLRGET